MSSIQSDLLNFLLAKREDLGIPEFIGLDFLPENKDALSIQSDGSPKVERAYIGGDKICNYSFTVLASSKGMKSAKPSLNTIEWLNIIGTLFEGMHNFQLSDSRRILSGEVTSTPSLVVRYETGHLAYSMSLNIRYEE